MSDDLIQLGSKNATAVAGALNPGEDVRVVVAGLRNQGIVATDSRVIVVKAGFMAGATFGEKMTTYAHSAITAIEVHKGMSTGVVVVRAAGETPNEVRYWANARKSGKTEESAYKARNAIPIARRMYKRVDTAVAALRGLLADASNPSPAAEPAPDPIAQIARLKELLDAGAVSDEEFAAKKAALLEHI